MPQSEKIDTDQWVDEYGDILYRYALFRVKDPHVAEELVQVTFFEAWKFRDRLKAPDKEKNWLYGILKHKILDHFREEKKKRNFDPLPEDDYCSQDRPYYSTGIWRTPPWIGARLLKSWPKMSNSGWLSPIV